MQVSRSKLTPQQKQVRKMLRDNLLSIGGRIYSFPESGVTFAVAPPVRENARFVQVAVAIMSPTENKFKRKVGEYHALDRLEYGAYIPMANIFSRSENMTEAHMYNLALALVGE